MVMVRTGAGGLGFVRDYDRTNECGLLFNQRIRAANGRCVPGRLLYLHTRHHGESRQGIFGSRRHRSLG